MNILSEITNFYQVFDWLGTSGQPTREQFQTIRNNGYQVVINLALTTSQNAIADEADLVKALGMDYCHIPVVWEEPKRTDLIRFFNVLEAFPGKKIFAHCVFNMRVSVFVYLYRVEKMGEREDVARKAMHKIWQPDDIWQRFISEQLNQPLPDL